MGLRVRSLTLVAAIVVLSSCTVDAPVRPVGNGCCIDGNGAVVDNPDAAEDEQADVPVPDIPAPPDHEKDEDEVEGVNQPCYVSTARDEALPPYPGLTIELTLNGTAGVAGAFLAGALTITNTNDFPVDYHELAPPHRRFGASAVEVLTPGTRQVVAGAPRYKPDVADTTQVSLLPGRSRVIPVQIPLLDCAVQTPLSLGSGLAGGTYDVRVGILTTSAIDDTWGDFYFWYAPRQQITVARPVR